MAKKKQPDAPKRMDPHVQGLRAEVMEQPICQTLEQNYMPYAMSVIVSPKTPVHNVQDGASHGSPDEIGKHCRPDDAIEPARRSGNL